MAIPENLDERAELYELVKMTYDRGSGTVIYRSTMRTNAARVKGVVAQPWRAWFRNQASMRS